MQNFKYILTHTSGNLTPVYSPIDWTNFNIIFKRSKRYHSVLRRQILDSEFPFDGKAYIDTIYAAYGIDTEIGCEIQYLDKQDGTYATLFEGVIDLSEWSSLRDTTSVKIIDSSTLGKFASRDEVQVPISRLTDLDGGTMEVYTYLSQMSVEGVSIEEKAEYDDSTNELNVQTPKTSDFTDHIGVSDAGYDFDTIGADATLPVETLGGASGPLYTNNSGSSITVRFRIITRMFGEVDVVASGAWTWQLRAFTGKNAATTSINKSKSGSGNDTEAGIDENYDSGYITETLANGETIEIYHQWEGTVTGPDSIEPDFTLNPTLIEVFEVIPAAAATDVDMPLLHELGAKLLEIMTGQTNPLNAPLLGRTDSEPRTYGGDGSFSLNGVASGFMIRGFHTVDQILKTSFADFFKSIDALFNLGMWYNQTNSEFTIAAKADFYKVSKIVTLGEVQELEISVAADHYFNNIKCGYEKDVSYEETNGTQVPNVPVEFANNVQRLQNTLDISSKYNGDDYGIELARQNQYRNTRGADTRYDNKNYFIIGQRDNGDYITKQGYNAGEYITITGVYSPSTRLNLDITPKRNLLRHLNQLSIPLFISNGDTNFMRSQMSLALSTQKSGDPLIAEEDDLAYADLEEPLYYPEIYSFNAELTIAIVLQLISDPHGYIEFDYIGVTYSGYILQVSTAPFNRRANWTLIKRNPNRV